MCLVCINLGLDHSNLSSHWNTSYKAYILMKEQEKTPDNKAHTLISTAIMDGRLGFSEGNLIRGKRMNRKVRKRWKWGKGEQKCKQI